MDVLIIRTMDEASRLFDQYARPEAKKVLVIITDKQSDSTINNIRDAAKPLAAKNVLVIPVAFGRDANPNELIPTTSDKGKLIKTDKMVPPKNLAKDIMDKILEGYYLLVYLGSIDSIASSYLSFLYFLLSIRPSIHPSYGFIHFMQFIK